MINIKSVFNKLLKDVEESSPNLKSALSEIAPICICISIKGHQKIYLVIDNDNSDITFQHQNHDFEGWFQSSAAYDEQVANGLLCCPICNSDQVKRALMTPNLASPKQRHCHQQRKP